MAELLGQAGLEDEEEDEQVGTQIPILAKAVVELLRSRASTLEDAESLENYLRQIATWERTVTELGRSEKTPTDSRAM